VRTPEEVAEGLVWAKPSGESLGGHTIAIRGAAGRSWNAREVPDFVAELRRQIAAAVRAAREEMFAHALGEPPVTREGLEQAREQFENLAALGFQGDARGVFAYAAHLEARVAHLARDSGYSEGYEAGLEAGRREEAERWGDLARRGEV
jgi:hypothetical protein